MLSSFSLKCISASFFQHLLALFAICFKVRLNFHHYIKFVLVDVGFTAFLDYPNSHFFVKDMKNAIIA